VFSMAAMLDPKLISDAKDPFEAVFNLGGSSNAAFAMLVFGVLAFIAAMAFDLQDPHRISRRGRSGFWLHVLAAPALVNTMVFTFYTMEGGGGGILTLISLVIVVLLALIIDRRSFLTAGLIYFAFGIGSAIERSGADNAGVLTLLILGVFVTLLGTFWTEIRSVLMRRLPDFPGKSRLPPFASQA